MTGPAKRPDTAAPLPPGVDAALLDETGHVAGDRPCHKCGYNLRTLAAAGRCPECATAVAESVQHAPAYSVRGLVTGADALAWSCGSLLLLFGAGIVRLNTRLFSDASVESLAAFLATIGMLVGACVGPILWLGGAMELTTRDPREIGRREGWSVRRLARWSLLGFTAPLPLLLLQGLDVPRWLVIGVLGFTAVVVALSPALLLLHGRDLARRVPDAALAKLCAQVSCISLALPALLVLEFAQKLSMHSWHGTAHPTGVCVILVIVFVLNAVVYARFSRRVRTPRLLAPASLAALRKPERSG